MKFRAASFGVVLGLLAASADAAPVLIVNGGILEGASGVVVGGGTYDVSFVDGSCAALFTGCDDVTDFTFQTQADAVSAAQALLASVFLDVPAGAFDTNPALTRGCTDLAQCFALIPFEAPLIVVNTTWTVNIVSDPGDQVIPTVLLPFVFDTLIFNQGTWAVFTPAAVPEPASLTLLGLGALGLGGYRRRRRQPSLE